MNDEARARIDQPGLYELPAAAYHADPCPLPSLSSSIARRLLAMSPRHAWWAHPRLNPQYEPEQAERFDLGTVAHAYLLEGKTAFTIVDAPDWRSKAAQAARAAAQLEGKTAVLAERWADVLSMAKALRRQLERFEDQPRPFAPAGKAEQTLIWREDDVWCRARLDWLHDDHRTIDDLKTGAVSANPDDWPRTMWNMGYDIQAAWYVRGLRALTGQEATFRFVIQENFAPFAAAVIGLGPDAMVLAEKKVLFAIDLWGRCLATGEWPAYPARTCWAHLPSWLETRWLEKETREERPRGVRDDGRPIEQLLVEGT